jgi:hypothetical protein
LLLLLLLVVVVLLLDFLLRSFCLFGHRTRNLPFY